MSLATLLGTLQSTQLRPIIVIMSLKLQEVPKPQYFSSLFHSLFSCIVQILVMLFTARAH